jgi:hypothetical protein
MGDLFQVFHLTAERPSFVYNDRDGPRHTLLNLHGVMPGGDLCVPCTIEGLGQHTVAVVVPSPATALVWLATSRTICTPMFSKRVASSMSLATVTPSLVDSGEPNTGSRTPWRPRGPRVIFTAVASGSIPRWMSPRAVVPTYKCFAGIVMLLGCLVELSESPFT